MTKDEIKDYLSRLHRSAFLKEETDGKVLMEIMVVSEAIQTILRREKYPQPYEALKALTRRISRRRL